MSAGTPHRYPNLKHPAELQGLKADPSFQEMWKRPYKVVTSKDVPDLAGYSVQGDEYYLDRDFFLAVHGRHSNQTLNIQIPSMSSQQVMECVLEHERTEKCLLDADNGINLYPGAHEYATLAEHEMVRRDGGKPYQYERGIAPVIKYCEGKPIKGIKFDPPGDLQCSPYIDEPDDNDKRVLKVLRGFGVPDASKTGKKDVNYRAGTEKRCGACVNFAGGTLAPCRIVDGLVRPGQVCNKFEASHGETEQASRLQGRGGEDRQAIRHPQPGSGPGGGQPQRQSRGQAQESPAGPGQRLR